MDTKWLKNLEGICKEHLPSILTGFGVMGVVGTGISAAKASPIAKEKLEKLENPTFFDKAKVVGCVYAPTIGIGVGTIACIIGANYEHARRYASLAGMYAVATNQLQEHKDKVAELFGADNTKQIEREIAQEQVKSKMNGKNIIYSSEEAVLCKDLVIGKVFKSSMTKIQMAMNKTNSLALMEGRASLSTFYEYLGEESPEIAENICWGSYHSISMMDISFDAEISEDGTPYLAFTYNYD